MTERSDIVTDWAEVPRIIEVADTSATINGQDLVDTLRSNTLQPGEADDSLLNMDDDFILDAEGKANLGGGSSTGIVSTLQNAQLAFESRLTPAETGTITTPDATGTILIDSFATFEANLVVRGALVVNFTDESITEVLSVDSEIQLTTRVLRAGTDNDYDAADVYKVWNVIQCTVTDGDLVAVDSIGDPLSPIFTTFATQVIIEKSTAGSISESAEILDIHGQVRRSIYIDTTAGVNGDGYQQTPYNNFTDAVDDAELNGITKLILLADATADRQLRNFVFEGVGRPTLDMNGQDFLNSQFIGIQLDNDYVSSIIARNCSLKANLTGVDGQFFNCGFQGLMTLADGASVIMQDCYSEIAGLTAPELSMNAAATIDQMLSMRNYSGGLTLSNSDRAGNEATLEYSQGKLTLAATNTLGTISVRGIVSITNNAGGATVEGSTALEPSKLLKFATWFALK